MKYIVFPIAVFIQVYLSTVVWLSEYISKKTMPPIEINFYNFFLECVFTTFVIVFYFGMYYLAYCMVSAEEEKIKKDLEPH